MRVSKGASCTTSSSHWYSTHVISKLDVNSEVEIIEAGRILKIRLVSGNVLVRVDNQQQQHETRVASQNLVMAVRGTMFTVGVDNLGNETVAMLSGHGEVNGVPLATGYMFVLRDDAGYAYSGYMYGAEYDAYRFNILPITVEAIDDFTLAAIVGNMDYLAYHLDLDLIGVDITGQALPQLYEISSLELEPIEVDEIEDEEEFCDDDCAPMVEPDEIEMPQDRRQVGRRC